ncbi:MFS transporter [Terribacillus sp. 179-K 1B1 HS]|uniref:MFS transporter n=1 Tax=Terribacillus sp. 179-K 1B1 HS TaxID=3142388 RepID=UPI00399F58DD
MVEEAMVSKWQLFRNRNFRLVFISMLFSAPGYYVYLMGAEWLMLSITENRFYFGMLFFAASVPRLLFIIIGGMTADRISKKLILLTSDASRAVLVGIVIGLLLMDMLQPWHLLVLSALFGVSDAFSYPAAGSLLPEVLKPDNLQQGNAMVQMTNMVSPIVGPAIGGSLIVLGGFPAVFTLAIVMLCAATLSISLLRTISTQKETTEIKQSPLEDVKAGFNYVKHNPLIRTIMIVSFFINFFLTGPVSLSVALLAKDVFQTNALGLTILEGALGIGSLAAALSLVLVKNLRNPGHTVIFSLIAMSAFFILYGAAIHFWTSAAAILAIGICLQLTNIPISTMLQQTTDRRMIGRVMSIMALASTGLIPVSYMVTSALLGMGVSIQVLCITGGILVMFTGILCLRNKQLTTFNSYNKEKHQEMV